MSAAFVIEVSGRQAGLVVREATGGFRFFAAISEAFALEGRVFETVAQATEAVRSLLSRRRAA